MAWQQGERLGGHDQGFWNASPDKFRIKRYLPSTEPLKTWRRYPVSSCGGPGVMIAGDKECGLNIIFKTRPLV